VEVRAAQSLCGVVTQDSTPILSARELQTINKRYQAGSAATQGEGGGSRSQLLNVRSFIRATSITKASNFKQIKIFTVNNSKSK
jgi:hypothetical protein